MKYLGMTLNTAPVRIANWKDLIIKVEKRIHNWAFRVLNALGRIIMLKSVLQSLPLYQLSGRACPKSICNQLVNLFKKFPWQGAQANRKWALLTWENILNLNLQEDWDYEIL